MHSEAITAPFRSKPNCLFFYRLEGKAIPSGSLPTPLETIGCVGKDDRVGFSMLTRFCCEN